ncbi:MAG TPA: hypothetical protein VMR65_00235 [Candidatus Sulfotelmatobacter sp.]|jgi:hypothetical protein|nr:hypothetical protein [Candidatus Sulfotelmatobacter sp.]
MNANSDGTACPFLKEVVMIYCDACPQHKLLPRNQMVSMGPCCSTDFGSCPLYREIARRAGASAPPGVLAGHEREVRS